MTSKGKQYSTIVRRAGLAWGKGDLQKAIAAVQEGIVLATENGDSEVVRVFQQDSSAISMLLPARSQPRH